MGGKTGNISTDVKNSFVDSPTRGDGTAQETSSIITGDDGRNVGVEDDRLKVKQDPTDFRLMIAYQSQILVQLEKLNLYMAIITDEEI